MNYKIACLTVFVPFLLFSGCSAPTYPKDKIEKAVVDIIKKEAGLDSIAVMSGSTFYLKADIPDLVSTKPEIPKKVIKKINIIVTAITRVALSSDANIEFLVVILDIPKWKTTLSLTQRLEDIKWSLYQKISIGDAEERIIYDLSANQNTNAVFKPITMRDFTARLLVSKFNWLVSSNPFLSAALNTRLEIKRLDENILLLKMDTKQTEKAAIELARDMLVEWSEKIMAKYRENSLKHIEVVNQLGEVILKIPNTEIHVNAVSK